jgi:hypothetical protein
MLVAAIVFKGLVEVMLVALFGQGVLFLLAGPRRHENLIYKLFAAVTAPIMKVTRFVTPRFVVDQHLGMAAFFLLAVLWLVALGLKVHYTLEAVRQQQEASGAARPPGPSTPSPAAPAPPRSSPPASP